MRIETIDEAVRRLMNTFKVDGLTRALTRQLQIADFLCFSLGFIGFLILFLVFRLFSYFEGVWALHTTVIRAADQREVGNLVRTRALKSTGIINVAEM